MRTPKQLDGLAALDARVASQEEVDKADVVICGPDSYFPDDVRTFCAQCAAPIVHRPHAPCQARKLCMRCAEVLLGDDDDPVFLTTERSLKEVKAYLFRH